MSSYKKQVKGDNNQANESWSGNRIQVFNDGSGKLIIIFGAIFITASLVYLAIFQTLLLTTSIVACFIFGIGGAGFLWYNHLRRDHSRTNKELLVNEEEVRWAKKLYVTEYLIATENPKLRFENAQQISIQQHHPAPQTIVSEWPQNRQERDLGGDGYSEVLDNE